MERYKVTQGPAHKAWYILDREWWDFCSLPKDDSQETPSRSGRFNVPEYLAWPTREGAEDWLKRCYRVWATWEEVGAPTPNDWHPITEGPFFSPFDHGMYDR